VGNFVADPRGHNWLTSVAPQKNRKYVSAEIGRIYVSVSSRKQKKKSIFFCNKNRNLAFLWRGFHLLGQWSCCELAGLVLSGLTTNVGGEELQKKEKRERVKEKHARTRILGQV
jgi:hypothetical protein